MDTLRGDYRPVYQATYEEYQTRRSQLLTRQQGERGQLKAMWSARHEDRRQALQQMRTETARLAVGKPDDRGAITSERPDVRIDGHDVQRHGAQPGGSEQQQRSSPAMKPPSEGRSASPPLPDSALAALRKASAAVDQAQKRESQQPKVDLQQGRGRVRKLE